MKWGMAISLALRPRHLHHLLDLPHPCRRLRRVPHHPFHHRQRPADHQHAACQALQHRVPPTVAQERASGCVMRARGCSPAAPTRERRGRAPAARTLPAATRRGTGHWYMSNPTGGRMAQMNGRPLDSSAAASSLSSGAAVSSSGSRRICRAPTPAAACQASWARRRVRWSLSPTRTAVPSAPHDTRNACAGTRAAAPRRPSMRRTRRRRRRRWCPPDQPGRRGSHRRRARATRTPRTAAWWTPGAGGRWRTRSRPAGRAVVGRRERHSAWKAIPEEHAPSSSSSSEARRVAPLRGVQTSVTSTSPSGRRASRRRRRARARKPARWPWPLKVVLPVCVRNFVYGLAAAYSYFIE